MNINKNKLSENFKNIKNIINFTFLKCYKKLFTKLGISNNIGCYILLIIILFHIISIFGFCIKDFSLLKKKIKKIISLKENDKTNKISKMYHLNTKKNSSSKNYIKKKDKKIKFNIKKILNSSRIKINSGKIEKYKNKKKILIYI